MSGIAFQKRYGDMTVANQTLDAVNKPDLYKMAKMFAPNKVLIAVTETWDIEIGNSKDSTVYFDGRYFGIFKIHLISSRTGSSNTNYRRSLGRLYDGSNVVCQSGTIVHGNDTAAWLGDHAEHYGFGTHMSLTTIGSDSTDQGLIIQFIGFKMGDLPNFELKVTNKSSNPIKVNILGSVLTVPRNGTISDNKPLGSHFSIYPLEENSIQINGVDYTISNLFEGNFEQNMDFTVLDTPILTKKINFPTDYALADYITMSIDGSSYVPFVNNTLYVNSYSLKIDAIALDSVYDMVLTDGVHRIVFRNDLPVIVNSSTPLFASQNELSFDYILIPSTFKLVSILPILDNTYSFALGGTVDGEILSMIVYSPEVVTPALPCSSALGGVNLTTFDGLVMLAMNRSATCKINGIEHTFVNGLPLMISRSVDDLYTFTDLLVEL